MNLNRLFLIVALVLELVAGAVFAGWVTSSQGFTFLAFGLASYFLAGLT